MSTVFGVDVGGSGVKGAPVDTEAGTLLRKRNRIETPRPATPDAVFDTIVDVIGDEQWDGPLGVAVPAVVVGGIARTAANIDESWIGTDVRSALAKRTGRDVVVLNDADAAGLAEVRFGAGRDVEGLVIVLTFGTGVGSGMFIDGRLVPNSELGHMEFEGDVAELKTAARLVEDDELSLRKWAERVGRYLTRVHRVFAPRRIVFGGGISKRFHEFERWLDVDFDIVAAELRNNAGIVGAAVAAETWALTGPHG